jgi:magnesium transporter
MSKQNRDKRLLRDSMLPSRASSVLPPRSSVRPNAFIPPASPVPPVTLLDEEPADKDIPSFPVRAARTLARMTSTVGELGRLVGSTLGLPGRQDDSGYVVVTRAPGAPAGIDHLDERLEPPEFGKVRLSVTDICQEHVETQWFDDIESLLEAPKPDWVQLRWIDVDGLHAYVISQLQQAYGFHTLAAEDVLHVPQRPRVDSYSDHLFVVARMFSARNEQLVSEQISMFIKPGLLVSFQELREDVWKPIRARLELESSTLRQNDSSYLAYCLLDAMIDHCFPILERYGEMLDHLEDSVLAATGNILPAVHAIKRELTILRKAIWPMREVLAELSRVDQRLVSDTTRTYLRDVYQHCIQIIDILETFRELAASLTDLSLSIASKRMNEIMKVLTMMSSVFIPITFLAGVYGMNFQYFPELHYRYSYLCFWVICVGVAVTLAWYFRRKGWWGKDS